MSILLTPGPVPLHPRVREALSQPMIHHRTPEFDAILKRVLLKLKEVFQTQQPAFVLSGTGSAGMECLLVNTIEPGDEVLVIDSGKFGERWFEMAQNMGAQAHRMKIPWGSAAHPMKVEEFLKNHPKTKAILCQACETSTAVVHPIEQIAAEVAKYPDCLFLVDGITALGAMPLPMDKWGIDGLVGGSQKAFMLPTGLFMVAFSEKAWKRIPKIKTPRFYLDIRKERSANEKGETYYSSNVTLIRALDVVLDILLQNGLEPLFRSIKRRAEFVHHFAPQLGFSIYADYPSTSVTAIRVPPTVDSQVLRTHLEKKYGITVMGGQDEAKGLILRVGHMGYIQDSDMVEFLMGLVQSQLDLDEDYNPPFTEDELRREAEQWLIKNP